MAVPEVKESGKFAPRRAELFHALQFNAKENTPAIADTSDACDFVTSPGNAIFNEREKLAISNRAESFTVERLADGDSLIVAASQNTERRFNLSLQVKRQGDDFPIPEPVIFKGNHGQDFCFPVPCLNDALLLVVGFDFVCHVFSFFDRIFFVQQTR